MNTAEMARITTTATTITRVVRFFGAPVADGADGAGFAPVRCGSAAGGATRPEARSASGQDRRAVGRAARSGIHSSRRRARGWLDRSPWQPKTGRPFSIADPAIRDSARRLPSPTAAELSQKAFALLRSRD